MALTSAVARSMCRDASEMEKALGGLYWLSYVRCANRHRVTFKIWTDKDLQRTKSTSPVANSQHSKIVQRHRVTHSHFSTGV